LSATANPQPLAACKSPGLAGNPQIPGDKSISHRALILGALAIGETTVQGLLEAGDVLNTASVLAELGASLARQPDGTWTIHGVGVGGFAEPSTVLDHGNSGTGVRLMMGAVATCPITATFSGDASLRRRPMGRVLEPLSRFGARATGRKGGLLPLTLTGATDPLPITYTLPVPSAQVKSSILLAGLNVPGRTTVIEPEATRDHTERMLRHFGADVTIEDAGTEGQAIALTGYPALKGTRVVVPPDPSSAAFPLVGALIVPGSQVTLSRVMLNPTRAGLFAVLRDMGASMTVSNQRLESGETVADIAVRTSALRAVETDPALAASMIDEFPILAIAAAFAEGTTRMNGLAELRVKESDRLAAVAAGLGEIGIKCRMGPDWLEVDGRGPDGVPGGGLVQTHMDHRIAMSFLVAGLAARAHVTVDDTAFIATSFPSFISMMQGLGAAFRKTAE
jgi:3-phosphoshikimate 1-carboxyvinyltransferase